MSLAASDKAMVGQTRLDIPGRTVECLDYLAVAISLWVLRVLTLATL